VLAVALAVAGCTGGGADQGREVAAQATAAVAASTATAVAAPRTLQAIGPPRGTLRRPASQQSPIWASVAPVNQGQALGVYVAFTHTAPPERVDGLFRGEALPFVLERDRAWAVAAVEPWAEAVEETLEVAVLYQDGHREELRQPVTVNPVRWTQANLSFDADTSRLLAPEIVNGEVERLDGIYRRVYPVRLWQGSFDTPTLGTPTSLFGERRSYGGGPPGQWHLGLDIAAPTGREVRASNSGIVVLAEPLAVRGNTVIVDHGWGIHSAYFHLATMRVQPGQRVAKGEVIATVGSTGLSTGPHLHWEMRVRGIATSPTDWNRREFGDERPAR
jgi:murein DD-endopeptidase MepM/ murein hydrolase activator NlpD